MQNIEKEKRKKKHCSRERSCLIKNGFSSILQRSDYDQLSKLVYNVAQYYMKNKTKIVRCKIRLFLQNGNLPLSKELCKMENRNKYDFIG